MDQQTRGQGEWEEKERAVSQGEMQRWGREKKGKRKGREMG